MPGPGPRGARPRQPALRRPAEIEEVVADPSKAARELGWEARTSFEELVEMMVRADLDELTG
ncbi:MAG: GDP-mannose 4,6-dehydratase [Solirubrobacterales bacterium]